MLVLSTTSGCGGSLDRPAATNASADSCHPFTVEAPEAESALIRDAVATVGACRVSDIELTDADPEVQPLPDYPGDRWLRISVRVTGRETNQVESDWEAARVAGEIRNRAAAAHLSVPFGYSIDRLLPTGEKLTPIDIVIGAPIGAQPSATSDPVRDETRIRRAVAEDGLSVEALAFRGTDRAVVVRASSSTAASVVLDSWSSVVASIVADPTRDWMVEVDDRFGSPIKAVASSASTAGVVGWTRPDLRQPAARAEP